MKKNFLKEVKWIFFGGTILIIFSPYLFTRSWGIIDFSSTGQIGDTIGGLTAPLTSLLGSILVFYALKAQIDANALIQNQIASQKEGEEIKKKAQYLFDNFKILREDINDYTVTEQKRTGFGLQNTQSHIVTHNGSYAFDYFISQLRNLRADQYDEAFEILPKLRELKILLESIELFVKQVEDSLISIEDKLYLKSLMAYQFNSKIKSPFKANERHKEKPFTDKLGNTTTKGIPEDLFILVDRIESSLN